MTQQRTRHKAQRVQHNLSALANNSRMAQRKANKRPMKQQVGFDVGTVSFGLQPRPGMHDASSGDAFIHR